jgi:asparaginyl-tRNA synthetase
VTQESTVRDVGRVKEDKIALRRRGPADRLEVLFLTEDYPITPKEHGTAFLMEHRHLWLRSSRQHAVLRVRSEVEQAIRDFFHRRDFVLIDSPILTAGRLRGHLDLFETDYFGEPAFLSQSGQLYLEPAAAALGKVYCFGPTFRAEKSKTRRHLMEFWMVEPEVAFLEFDGLATSPRSSSPSSSPASSTAAGRARGARARRRAKLERSCFAVPPHHLREASTSCREGLPGSFGDDLGGDEETALAEHFDKPVMVTRYPAAIEGLLHAARPGRPGAGAGPRRARPRGLRRDHRRQPAHPRPRPAARSASRSTACRSRPSSGTSTCAATAASRTAASAWASSASSPGCAASPTCARRSPTRACSTGSTPEASRP